MIAIGVGAMWAGYTVGMWGYCLIRGYDVPFTAMFKSQWPGLKVSTDTPGQVVRPGGHKLGTILGNQGTA